MLKPKELDVASVDWPVEPHSLDAIIACNILHISPYFVTEGLFAGAGRMLASQGVLCVYGPFMIDGEHTSPSNEAFDARLRGQNDTWGVRDVATLIDLAKSHNLEFVERVQMPANNLTLVFRQKTQHR